MEADMTRRLFWILSGLFIAALFVAIAIPGLTVS
jgi:hypothetical protein